MTERFDHTARSELGRSMVEMLGTLAIMGVLTIGGVAGYRYAINKSNANTILGAVSQMAVTASTELTTQGSLTLPEWKDANGNLSISGAYGVETAQNNDGTFSITVSNMNDEVCERIKGMDWKVPEDVAINDESDVCDQGEANTITFVFSNTLTKKSAPGNAGGESGEDTPDEPETPTCGGTYTGTTETGQGGYAGTITVEESTVRCYCEAKDTVYNTATGQCESKPDSCTSYRDCNNGEYCQFSPSGCEDSDAPTTGTCQSLTECGDSGTYTAADGKTFWMSDYGGSCVPDWWTAKDICGAKGKTMVSLSDIKCNGSTWSCSDNYAKTLGSNLNEYGIWTTDMYDSCSAFLVSLGDGHVYGSYRYYDGDVLCR
ncbi:MAG: hypothetical protein IJV07_04500 [Alphaproteobacteria bacterium]|nr:hypothetical protein [Alphaproteobacteria bacterium]